MKILNLDMLGQSFNCIFDKYGLYDQNATCYHIARSQEYNINQISFCVLLVTLLFLFIWFYGRKKESDKL